VLEQKIPAFPVYDGQRRGAEKKLKGTTPYLRGRPCRKTWPHWMHVNWCRCP
jgi:hypothetical protein